MLFLSRGADDSLHTAHAYPYPYIFIRAKMLKSRRHHNFLFFNRFFLQAERSTLLECILLVERRAVEKKSNNNKTKDKIPDIIAESFPELPLKTKQSFVA